jgi:hypothetical protein
MGRKVGAKLRNPRALSPEQLLHEETAAFNKATVAWNRRMTLLSFSSQVCGPDTHPDEITRFAGTFERFVLEGTEPERPGEVVALTVTPKKVVLPVIDPEAARSQRAVDIRTDRGLSLGINRSGSSPSDGPSD